MGVSRLSESIRAFLRRAITSSSPFKILCTLQQKGDKETGTAPCVRWARYHGQEPEPAQNDTPYPIF